MKGGLDAVWRTQSPEVEAVLDQAAKDARAYARRIKKLLKELDPSGKRKAMESSGWGSRRFVGMTVGDAKNIPEGWRLDRKNWMLVPARSTKEGKAVAAKVDACQPPADARSCLPGMPGPQFTGLSFCSPGIEHREGWWWVCWPADAVKQVADKVDPAIWERVKFSEFIAMQERTAGATE